MEAHLWHWEQRHLAEEQDSVIELLLNSYFIIMTIVSSYIEYWVLLSIEYCMSQISVHCTVTILSINVCSIIVCCTSMNKLLHLIAVIWYVVNIVYLDKVF